MESREQLLTIGSTSVTIDTMKRKPKSFAPIIREAIRESGLSLQQLADASGVDRASLSRFVRGERTLRLDKACQVATYLGLELVKRKRTK